MKTCRKCGRRLLDRNVSPGYKYWCPRCDEELLGMFERLRTGKGEEGLEEYRSLLKAAGIKEEK